MANNFLPIFDNLWRHNLHVNRICPLCKVAEESVDHLLRHCSFSNQVFTLLKIKLLLGSHHSDYMVWLADSFKHIDAQTRKIMVITYLVIWHSHNRTIHEGLRPKAHEVKVFVRGYLLEIEALEELKSTSSHAI